jgi:hypothetical protein
MKLNTDMNDLEIFNEAVMNAHWILNEDSLELSVLPTANDDFEAYCADNDEEFLLSLSDDQLADEEFLENKGYSIVPQVLRRFSPEAGYYSA